MTEREKIIELAKGCGAVSEPVAWLQTSVKDGVDTVIARTYKPDKFNAEWWRFDPLYLHPLPQPDLVDENERKTWALLMKADIEQLREQLATAQASETELLKPLERFANYPGLLCDADYEIARAAIAAHKARKDKA